jgi:hypothetical protein
VTGLAPVFDEGIKHHENGNIADARRGRRHHRLRDHRPHLVPEPPGDRRWIFILTGVAGAIITRSSRLRLRRTPVAKGRPGAAAANGTAQRPPPSRRPVPGAQPAAARDATPAEHETIEEYAGA